MDNITQGFCLGSNYEDFRMAFDALFDSFIEADKAMANMKKCIDQIIANNPSYAMDMKSYMDTITEEKIRRMLIDGKNDNFIGRMRTLYNAANIMYRYQRSWNNGRSMSVKISVGKVKEISLSITF